MKINIVRKRSALITMLVSYAVIFILPFIVSMTLYIQAKAIVENEIKKSHLFFLSKVQENIDNMLSDVKNLAYEIAFNDQVNSFSRGYHDFSDTDYYEIYTVQKSLNSYGILKGFIGNIYVYHRGLGLFITKKAVADQNDYFRLHTNLDEQGRKEWIDTVNRKFKGNFLTINDQSRANGEKTLAYIISVPVIGVDEPQTNIIIVLKKEAVLQYFAGIETLDEGYITILDGANHMIVSSNNDASGNALKHNYFAGINHTSAYFTIDGGYMVSYLQSKVNDWKYVSAIPSSVFWKRVDMIKLTAFMITGVCLLAGILLIIYFLRKNYNPLNSLVKNMGNYQKNGSPEHGNQGEYELISTVFSNVVSERDKFDFTLRQQKSEMRMAFFRRLLKGTATMSNDIYDKMISYEIDFTTNYFGVIVFELDDLADHGSIGGQFLEERKILLSESLRNAAGNMEIEKYKTYSVDMDELIIIIVNVEKESQITWKDLVQKEKNILIQNDHIRLRIAASNIYEGINGIAYAYDEALRVLEYKKAIGMEDILFIEEINESTEALYYFPTEKEYQLSNQIKVGDRDKSKALIDEIVMMNTVKGHPSIKILKCLFYDIIGTLLKSVNTADDKAGDFLLKTDLADKLLMCKTVGELKNQIYAAIDGICEKMAEEKNGKKPNKLKNDVIDYVHKNYKDYNMSIVSIADHFKVRPVFLSRDFREITGESLLEYISKIRINNAKELLLTTSDTVEEVSARTGFSNARSFIRSFVKIEGIPPGKFREIN